MQFKKIGCGLLLEAFSVLAEREGVNKIGSVVENTVNTEYGEN